MRNISFMLTTPQFLDRSKTVTRRNGWRFLKIDERLQGVEKSQGLGKGGKIKRLGVIKVIDLRPEPLSHMLDDLEYGREECVREGFSEMSPNQFVAMFLKSHRGVTVETELSRIVFGYEEGGNA